jgi:predicted metal-dependent hydrolase
MAESAELVVPWGDRGLSFTLIRSARKTLRIAVAPDGRVCVYAPIEATDDEVCRRVARRSGWISRQLQQFDHWRPRTPPRQYLSGETHLFLGHQYRLHVTSEGAPDVRLDGDRLVLAVREDASFTRRRTLLQHWYTLQSHRIFPQRLDVAAPPFLRLGITKPRLIIRALARRWGSYTAAGNLVLNRDLVRASPHLIDYVVTHELAHAAHPDHGPEWQSLVTRAMPDWRERKRELEKQLL